MGAVWSCCCCPWDCCPCDCCRCDDKIRSTRSRLMSRESSAGHRFSRLSIKFSKINPLAYINGYEKEPLVSLEEALKPFGDEIDHLSDYIKVAKKHCHYPSEHYLTSDESAAIYIYTMQWKPRCVYDHLETAWNARDPSTKLKPWFRYLKLLKSAFDKLPDEKKVIWQGIAYNEQDKNKLSSKSLSMYSSMGTCSLSANEVKEYLQNKNDPKIILVGYELVNGKSMAGYTADGSNEVMIWPGTKLGLAKPVEVNDDGSLVFHLTRQTDQYVKHFVCPYKGCGNRCPEDHITDHCHGFAILTHECHHHCEPCHEYDQDHKCDECHGHFSNLHRCYNCGRCYCTKHCFE